MKEELRVSVGEGVPGDGLGFNPAEYGVDVATGTVGGRKVGFARAVMRAIAAHETAVIYGARPHEMSPNGASRNGSGNGHPHNDIVFEALPFATGQGSSAQ